MRKNRLAHRFDDFRRGLCQARHDFVMLTDHPESFSATPFEEALLYRAERGDELVERAGQPAASWASCPDGSRALIMAGFEGGTMSVGLEHHATEEEATRDALYRDVSAESIQAVQATGALGHAIAHTGSARALLFAPETIPPGTADLLRQAGFRRIVRFRTGEVR